MMRNQGCALHLLHCCQLAHQHQRRIQQLHSRFVFTLCCKCILIRCEDMITRPGSTPPACAPTPAPPAAAALTRNNCPHSEWPLYDGDECAVNKNALYCLKGWAARLAIKDMRPKGTSHTADASSSDTEETWQAASGDHTSHLQLISRSPTALQRE